MMVEKDNRKWTDQRGGVDGGISRPLSSGVALALSLVRTLIVTRVGLETCDKYGTDPCVSIQF